MRNKETFQPELELIHKDSRSRFNGAGRLAGRVALDAVSAISRSVLHRGDGEEAAEYPERLVIDFIEDNVAYAEIQRPNGNVNQLVLPFKDLSFLGAIE
ncbi:MAG: hypothetical protein WCJ05_01960 [bacterium]